LTLSENHKAAAQRHLHSLRPFADFTLAIHPFCGGTKRLWPTHRFVEFCRQVLVRPGQRIIAFGASPERKELESWKKELGKGFITLPETFDLEESLAILSQCDAFVGLDSGFSHAAAAFGVSTIAVFGPSDPDRFRPVGAGRVKVIKREPLENLRADEMIAELRYIKEP
jgi:ADP-heptose:LPS heptosyltransferase